MKKIATIAFLALLLTNCKQTNSNEASKTIEKTTDTIAALKTEQKEKEAEQKEDCKDIEVEMGSGKECIVQETDLAKVYQNIIKDKEVEESEYFLSVIPSEDKSVEVNQNGLISIDYQITKNKVAISMNYEGGVTEVTLEKINNTIKRSIYHYAD